MDDFRIDTSTAGPAATLRVAGEIDAATAPLLDEAFRKVESDVGVTSIDVDMSGVTFIDSSGLSVLVATHKRVRARNVSLSIVNVTASTRRLFSIAGLDTVLTIR